MGESDSFTALYKMAVYGVHITVVGRDKSRPYAGWHSTVGAQFIAPFRSLSRQVSC